MSHKEVLAALALVCLATLVQRTTAVNDPFPFANDLSRMIAVGRQNENVVYSPLSIQTALVIIFVGVRGQTANELRNVCRLGNSDKVEIIQQYSRFLNEVYKKTVDGPVLTSFTRVYVRKELALAPKFNKYVSSYLDARAQKTSFSSHAVKKMNRVIEMKTKGKIKNTLSEDSVDQNTNILLVNMMYLKGRWAHEFDKRATKKLPFWVSARKQVDVDTMVNTQNYNYAYLPELDASIVELPYKNSNLSMVIVLPNKKDGLQELERKLLKHNPISTGKTKPTQVMLYLPKFKIEYDIDLKEPLQKLGLTSLFSDRSADFLDLFDIPPKAMVDKFAHKAYLEVDESGTEAATVRAVRVGKTSEISPITVRVDHPFVFVIADPYTVHFAGHVVKL